jgi:2-polyprenyl-6-methoxyphenol hydroxylase-like FAD-dependent oxidoreductase
MGTKHEHAVVVGGSIAGLLAARVLAERFERVTVVERDRFPEEPAPRAGVPQGRHLHVLLVRGLEILEELLPGARAELEAAGAHPIDAGWDLAWRTPAGWGARFRSGLVTMASSRALLDWVVRRRLAAVPNVRFLEGSDVEGLVPDVEGRVQGITVRRRGDEPRRGGTYGEPRRTSILADLVVDASGRASRAPQWLEAFGCRAPEETTVDGGVSYASRIFRRPAGAGADWKAIFVQAVPPHLPRMGVLFPIEGDRWLLTLSGRGDVVPPADDAGFLEYSRGLASPAIYEAIRDAEPLTPVVGYRATENRWRHYERLDRMPRRFLVLGDAMCAFNPVYGQGMTTAALGAETLRDALDRAGSLDALNPGFQRGLSRAVRAAWDLATGEDMRYPDVKGANATRAQRLMHRYADRVVALTTEDVEVRERWLRVFTMVDPPTALFSPLVLARAVAGKREPSGIMQAVSTGA